MDGQSVDERYRGPWPAVDDLIAIELDAYLRDAVRPELRTATTHCESWTGDQLTAHIVETFRRFSEMLARSRSGDFSPPFEARELSQANLEAVDGFDEDPVAALRPAVEEFCRAATEPNELMAHQFGPIPVGLQATFGLAELALHHDDLLRSTGRRYRASQLAAERIAAAYEVVMERSDLLHVDDCWNALLTASNRLRG